MKKIEDETLIQRITYKLPRKPLWKSYIQIVKIFSKHAISCFSCTYYSNTAKKMLSQSMNIFVFKRYLSSRHDIIRRGFGCFLLNGPAAISSCIKPLSDGWVVAQKLARSFGRFALILIFLNIAHVAAWISL